MKNSVNVKIKISVKKSVKIRIVLTDLVPLHSAHKTALAFYKLTAQNELPATLASAIGIAFEKYMRELPADERAKFCHIDVDALSEKLDEQISRNLLKSENI